MEEKYTALLAKMDQEEEERKSAQTNEGSSGKIEVRDIKQRMLPVLYSLFFSSSHWRKS